MAIYGTITQAMRSEFLRKFGVYYSFNPAGTEWTSLGDALRHVNDREEFRESFDWPRMVLMLREKCERTGLTREDRISAPGHVDTVEGYYGLERKTGKQESVRQSRTGLK